MERAVSNGSGDQQRWIAIGTNEADLLAAGDDSGRPLDATRRGHSLLMVADSYDREVGVRTRQYLVGADVERVAVGYESFFGIELPSLLEVGQPGSDPWTLRRGGDTVEP